MPSDAERAEVWKEAAEALDFAFRIHPMPQSRAAFDDAEAKLKKARALEKECG